MADERSWAITQSALDFAANLGEEVARLNGFLQPPVDPFQILNAESRRVRSFGANFGEAFDDRLEYQQPHFLLYYNTKYDQLPHEGAHHPKVRFTIGHELGHYFLDDHREYLVHGGIAHRSFSEFTADPLVERQADNFAGGLLLPRYLLGPLVNRHANPTMRTIMTLKQRFDVSLVSMLVRWVQVSDFPCAVASCRKGTIEWGFVSDAFKKRGVSRVRRGKPVESRDAKAFIAADPACLMYREGGGGSIAMRWLETESITPVDEMYVTLPYVGTVMVFMSAAEMDDDAEED